MAVRLVRPRRLVRAGAVDDEGLQARAENVAEIAFERPGALGKVSHTGIIDECVFGS